MTKIFPRKRFGQHFLHDKGAILRIVDAIAPDSETPIVEIGPGLGALTLPLLARAGRLDVVEIDRDLARDWIDKSRELKGLQVHVGDALEFDYCSVSAAKIKVVGNLPYNISTPLLFHLLDQFECINEMVFMMQKELVDRLCAEPDTGDYGRLTVMVQSRCQVERVLSIGPGAFKPPPKVESTVVRLRPLVGREVEIQNPALFAALVKQAFSQRRKTLRNALKGMVDEVAFTQVGIASTIRAENLSVNDFILLANTINRSNMGT